MTTLRLERTWGSDAGRLPAGFTSVVLTDDPAVAYVLGQVGDRGALRVLDVRSGETLRELSLPPLVSAGGRVLVVRDAKTGKVIVGLVEGGGCTLAQLGLHDGGLIPDAHYPRAVTQFTELDHEMYVVVDGVMVDSFVEQASQAPDDMHWYSRDLRWCVREQRGAPGADGVTPVRLSRSACADGTGFSHGAMREFGTSTGRGVSAVFSDDGRRFWRILDRPRGGAYQERWALPEGRREDIDGYVHAPSRYVAVRDDRPDPLVVDGSGHLLPKFEGDGAPWSPRDACVSPDGRRAARVQWGVLRVTDLTLAADLSPCDAHSTAVMSAAFSPDGTLAATADTRGDVVVWSLAQRAEVWRFEAGDCVDQILFSPDARRLYAAVTFLRDKRPGMALRVWDLASGVEVTPAPMEFVGWGSVAMSPSGTCALLARGVDLSDAQWIDLGTWQTRSVASGSPAQSLRTDVRLPPIRCVAAFSEDAATAWMHLRDRAGWERVTLDGRTGAVIARQRWEATAAEPFSPTMGHARALLSYKVAEGVELHAFRLDDPSQEARWTIASHCDALAVGPTRCVTGASGGALRVSDEAGAPIAAAVVPGAKWVTAVAISRDERRVLAATLDGRVHLCALDP